MAGVGVDVDIELHLGAGLPDPSHEGIEVIDLEPHCDTVTSGVARVDKAAVVMLDVGAV